MMFWQALFCCSSLFAVCHGKSYFSDFASGKGPLKQAEAVRFINKLNILNKLQADILDVKLPLNDENQHSNKYFDEIVGNKPEETPYLFEGDMVLTDDQMDMIIRNVRDQYWARKFQTSHALGFYHEQARYDRDDYVSILTQNIQSSYLSQFSKQSFSSMVDYGVGYDYGSVMHYDQLSFSSTGGNTIATTDPNYQATIGQRVAPSFADVKRINLAYCNSSCTSPLNCENGGYTNPNDCSNCKCPPGFGGQLCNTAGNSDAGCGAANLDATNNIQKISASGALTCNYVITAPTGAKIYFQMTGATFSRSSPCTTNYLEINYRSDFTRVGARFCTSYPTISLSETNKLVVIYKGVSGSAFSLSYRYDPVNLSTTTPPNVQTTTKSVATSTTTTTTPKPTLPPTSSTTTIKTPNTTQSSTTQTTTSQTTTTTSVCSAWSNCSAQCGGCGTQSRRCGSYVETVYCNTTPCTGGYCCRPFFFVTQYSVGYCKRPSLDNSENKSNSYGATVPPKGARN
uniref:Metalloendopeptidase n=1 Tax=Caenorhabditis japonica TaxID=281687 RepID=A0A8R1DYV8_CAEJA